MNAPQTPGWYGKLSCLGDFAHRRLSRDWVDRCDVWLSGALRDSRAALGDGWLDVYLTAPILRFAWAPGIIDRQWWFGVLMSSCDNVGRYYPLVIAQPRSRPPEDEVALDHLASWFEQVGDAAMATLAESGASLDDLEDALSEAAPWPAVPGRDAAPAPGKPGRDDGWVAEAAGGRLADCSAWWQATQPPDPGGARIVRGLPDGVQILQLWRSWNETVIDPTM